MYINEAVIEESSTDDMRNNNIADETVPTRSADTDDSITIPNNRLDDGYLRPVTGKSNDVGNYEDTLNTEETPDYEEIGSYRQIPPVPCPIAEEGIEIHDYEHINSYRQIPETPSQMTEEGADVSDNENIDPYRQVPEMPWPVHL